MLLSLLDRRPGERVVAHAHRIHHAEEVLDRRSLGVWWSRMVQARPWMPAPGGQTLLSGVGPRGIKRTHAAFSLHRGWIARRRCGEPGFSPRGAWRRCARARRVLRGWPAVGA